MAKLKEQGTIADIPLRSTSRLYFVRVENNQPVDQGWVTVDEAKKVNATDRRMHGSPMNRYFQDSGTADAFTQSLGAGGPIQEMPPAPPEDFGAGLPPPEGGLAPEGEMGPEGGMPPEGEPEADMGMGAEDMDVTGGEEPSDEAGIGDLGLEDDGLGDLSGEAGDLGLGLEDEDKVLEITVPRRIKLIPESMQERIPMFRGEPRFANPPAGMFDEPEVPEQTAGAPDDLIARIDKIVQEETGMSLDALYDAMGQSDADMMMQLVDEAEGRGDSAYKVVSILHDFHPYKRFVKKTEEPGDRPWSEAPQGNPVQYSMKVGEHLIQQFGPLIMQKLSTSSPDLVDAMNDIMTTGFTTGRPPEETARDIIQLFEQRGDAGPEESQEYQDKIRLLEAEAPEDPGWDFDRLAEIASEKDMKPLEVEKLKKIYEERPEDFDDGMKVEQEHTDCPACQRIITCHHIQEFDEYYPELKTMEDKLAGEEADEGGGAEEESMDFESMVNERAGKKKKGEKPKPKGKHIGWMEIGGPNIIDYRSKSESEKRGHPGAETTETGIIEALIAGDCSAEEAINEQIMGTVGQVGYSPQQQAVGRHQVQHFTQGIKAPRMQWGQQKPQQPGAQIPQELQPIYQQYQQAMQSGDQATAQKLRSQLEWELQLQGVDPKTVLR